MRLIVKNRSHLDHEFHIPGKGHFKIPAGGGERAFELTEQEGRDTIAHARRHGVRALGEADETETALIIERQNSGALGLSYRLGADDQGEDAANIN